jgi:hypothetical protein
MITRPILEAQLRLYQEGQTKAIAAHAKVESELEKAKFNLAAAAGAIECCENFLRLIQEYEEAQKSEVKADKQIDKE